MFEVKAKIAVSEQNGIKGSELVHPSRAFVSVRAEANHEYDLTKRTTRLSFGATREEIFAAILRSGWSDLLSEVDRVLQNGGPQETLIGHMVACIASYMDEHSFLHRLDALVHGLLERRLTREAWHIHKEEMTKPLRTSATHIEKAFNLDFDRSATLLMRTYALVRGLQLTHNDQGKCRAEEPSAFRMSSLTEEVAQALREYWAGALLPLHEGH